MEQLILSLIKDMNAKLDSVLVQTTRTNGRVSALEEKHNRLEETQDEHEKILQTYKNESSETKGRNKVIWLIAGAIGTILISFIIHLLEKIKL